MEKQKKENLPGQVFGETMIEVLRSAGYLEILDIVLS